MSFTAIALSLNSTVRFDVSDRFGIEIDGMPVSCPATTPGETTSRPDAPVTETPTELVPSVMLASSKPIVTTFAPELEVTCSNHTCAVSV